MTTDTLPRWWVTVSGTASRPLTEDERDRFMDTFRPGFAILSDDVNTNRLSISFTHRAATEEDAKTNCVQVAQMVVRAIVGEPLTDLDEAEVEADPDE